MTAADTTHVITCPSCQARFAVAAEMASRRGRCAACGEAFTVPLVANAPDHATHPEAEPRKPAAAKAQYISVDCRVCGTRLTGRSERIGKKIKCPDCGAGTVLPEPAPPKPKNMPAALEGDQYELWDIDDQPLPSEIQARQPKYIAVVCRQCGTLMHANEIQVGQQIVCPDCGTRQPVPIAPKQVAKKSVLAPDRETPVLDLSSPPAARPQVIPHTLGQTLAEQEAEEEYQRALAKSLRTGKPMEIDERGRPIMPKWPLVSGVLLPFLVSSSFPAIWMGISLGFMCAGWILLSGLQMAMSGGMGAIAGMCFFAVGCVFMMLCLSAFGSFMMQVVTESTTGNRQIQSWPTLIDWFGSLPYTIVGGMISAIPGRAIGHIPLLSSNPAIAQLLTAISIGVFYPIILLSQLDYDSPWGVLSGRVLGSLVRCPFSWAFFYLECAVIGAICYFAMSLMANGGDVAKTITFHGEQIDFVGQSLTWLLLMPLFMLALFVMARLLGRLGWRLADAVAFSGGPQEDDEVRPRGPRNYNPPRAKKSAT